MVNKCSLIFKCYLIVLYYYYEGDNIGANQAVKYPGCGLGQPTLVGEPMMVGSGDFWNQSAVRGEEPSSLVGDVPRLAGRPI